MTLTELIENHKLTDDQKENLRSCYRAYLENKARSLKGQQHDK